MSDLHIWYLTLVVSISIGIWIIEYHDKKRRDMELTQKQIVAEEEAQQKQNKISRRLYLLRSASYERWESKIKQEERRIDAQIAVQMGFSDHLRGVLEDKPFRTNDSVGTDPCELWFPDEEIGIDRF